MSNQRKLSVLLSFVLFLSLCTPTFATDNKTAETSASVASTPKTPSILQGNGTVKEVSENQLTIETENKAYPVLTLNISDKTIMMDSQTGKASTISSLKIGDAVYAYYSAAMTRSIPPQSSAYAVLTNLKQDKLVPTHLHTVGSVEDKEDGSIKVLTSDGSLFITVLKDTPISMFNSDKAVSINDLKPGTDFFAWYEVVALSYPGQTGASKIVLLPQNILPQEKVTELQLNGETLDAEFFEDNGNIMVPVRDVAEKLGFTVRWIPSDRSVSLDDGSVKTIITLGQDSYYKASSKAIGLTAPFEFGSAPTVRNGKTYVPAKLFNLLYSNDNAVTIINGVINITNK